MLTTKENINLPTQKFGTIYSPQNGILNGHNQKFVEQGKNVILLTCGCFNPPHFGHLRMIKLARNFLEKNCGVNVLGAIVSPVCDKYRQRKKSLAAAEHRIQMCELLIGEMGEKDWIGVSRWEAEQSNWEPIIGVLRHHQKMLEKKHSDAKLLLLCGGDLLIEFLTNEEWDQNELPEILRQFRMVVGTRGTNVLEILANSQKKEIWPFLDRMAIFEDDGQPQMSSTQIREAIGKGEKDVEEMGEFTGEMVLKYISKNGLYAGH